MIRAKKLAEAQWATEDSAARVRANKRAAEQQELNELVSAIHSSCVKLHNELGPRQCDLKTNIPGVVTIVGPQIRIRVGNNEYRWKDNTGLIRYFENPNSNYVVVTTTEIPYLREALNLLNYLLEEDESSDRPTALKVAPMRIE